MVRMIKVDYPEKIKLLLCDGARQENTRNLPNSLKVSPSISIGFMVNCNTRSEQSNTGRNNKYEILQKRFRFLTSGDMSLKNIVSMNKFVGVMISSLLCWLFHKYMCVCNL